MRRGSLQGPSCLHTARPKRGPSGLEESLSQLNREAPLPLPQATWDSGVEAAVADCWWPLATSPTCQGSQRGACVAEPKDGQSSRPSAPEPFLQHSRPGGCSARGEMNSPICCVVLCLWGPWARPGVSTPLGSRPANCLDVTTTTVSPNLPAAIPPRPPLGKSLFTGTQGLGWGHTKVRSGSDFTKQQCTHPPAEPGSTSGIPRGVKPRLPGQPHTHTPTPTQLQSPLEVQN